MFSRVLAPLDGSRAATERLRGIAALCRYFAAELVLLTVIDDRQREAMLVDLPTSPESNLDEMVDPEDLDRRVRIYLDRAMTILSRAGIDVSSEVINANADAGILLAASDLKCDLIAISPNTHKPSSRIFIGSTTELLVHSSAVPVFIVKEGSGSVFSLAGRKEASGGTVLVPLDGSAEAEGALGFAFLLAKRMGIGLKLASVVPPARESGNAGELELDTIRRDLADYLSRIVDYTAQDEVQIEYEVAFGDPTSEFIKMANRLHHPIVVISSRRRSMASPRLVGSFTEQVELRMNHPIFAVPRRG